ncbi:MAG: glycosaminoglycan attachment protein [Gemmatimonadetes bacterium]|nr:glycosaminoglycan attachment protein [Gemmatimonadota bacterium]
MMEEVFAACREHLDCNFVEQFQTTGFDARLFELFLFAYFKSIGADVERAAERPDYLVCRNGTTVAVEATTANPTQRPGETPKLITGVDLRALVDEDEQARVERSQQELPIRLGSALYSKLNKRYWKLPHVKGRALVLAIQPFYSHDSLLFSSAGIAQYLYGIRQTGRHDEQGKLVIDTAEVEEHQLAEKKIPSNFFAQPETEHISAVLYTNVAAVSKFTRMGYQAGLHRGNVLVSRRGAAWDPDPNAKEAAQFSYRLDEDPGPEPWGSGVEVFLNPRALHSLPEFFFDDAIQTSLKDGVPVSLLKQFVPFVSITQRLTLKLDSLAPVEDRRGHVGTILRREFDAFQPKRPPYKSGEVPFSEVAWFADAERRLIGTVFRWHGQERYGVAILGPDEAGRWRAIDTAGDVSSLDVAAKVAIARMQQIVGTGETVFPQGD